MARLFNPNSLHVNEIFYSIQGEGPYTGFPAVFIRLAGCNQNCSFCDTKHQQGEKITVRDIWIKVCEVMQSSTYPPLIVITGGEPTLQDLSKLISLLLTAGHLVQIETNGSVDLPEELLKWYDMVTVVCSPKALPVSVDIEPYIDAYKLLVGEGTPSYDLNVYLRYFNAGKDIYVQPVETDNLQTNSFNVKRAIKLCLSNGFKLSIQTHKLIGVK